MLQLVETERSRTRYCDDYCDDILYLPLSLSPRISEGKDVLSQGKESNAEWVLIENEKGPSSSFSISESREGNEVNPSQLSQFPVGA